MLAVVAYLKAVAVLRAPFHREDTHTSAGHGAAEYMEMETVPTVQQADPIMETAVLLEAAVCNKLVLTYLYFNI